MKKLLLVAFAIAGFFCRGQEAEINKSIDTFFEGLHAKDTLKIHSVCSDSMILESITENAKGSVLERESLKEFYTSIASVPKDVTIEERLLSRNIQIDGTMAHAWTPYEFYVNGKFSHSGVDSFVLYKGADGKWRIIYIVDTRRVAPRPPKGE